MPSHAGVFFFDRRPAAGARRALCHALRASAPDGVDVHTEDGIAMAFGACHTWRGDREAHQPVISRDGGVVTWDGRLDNRDDLLLQLPADGPHASDASIALRAFERWGVEGLRNLVGDWSAAIWNPRERTVHLARDVMGVRPLYYYVGHQSVMWSVSLADLAVRSGRCDAISPRFVAGFMTLRFSGNLTPYEGIHSVPAGACVSFRAASPRETRTPFWQLESAVMRYRDSRQYEEHLRSLWRDAVVARLRLDEGAHAWAELSGGLDSSSVVCMADAQIRERTAGAVTLRLASHATLESPEGDERRFIRDVEAQVGVRADVLGVEAHADLVDDEWGWVTPLAARGVGLARVRRITACGGRMVLSGRGGDAVMGCDVDNSSAVLDEIASGAILRALGNIRRWSRATRKPFVEIAWRLVRPRFDAEAVRLAEQSRAGAVVPPIALLTRELRVHADTIAVESSLALAKALSNVRPAKRQLAALLLGYSLESRLNLPHQPPGVVFTYPFMHRPLVEYVMAIPGEQLSAPGETRSLMRRAFAGFVPARILARRSKGYYPPSSARAMRSAVSSLGPVDRLQSVARGWIEPSVLDAVIRSVADGGGQGSAELRRVMRLEEWLQSRHRRAPADIPQREEVNNDEVLNA